MEGHLEDSVVPLHFDVLISAAVFVELAHFKFHLLSFSRAWLPRGSVEKGAVALGLGLNCCRWPSPDAGLAVSTIASVSAPRSSNRTCRFAASGSRCNPPRCSRNCDRSASRLTTPNWPSMYWPEFFR